MNDADRKRVDEVLAYAKEQGIGMKFHKIYLPFLYFRTFGGVIELLSVIVGKHFFAPFLHLCVL